MRILITGLTGFVGQKLGSRLVCEGHELIGLSRNAKRAQASSSVPAKFYSWDPLKEAPPVAALGGVEAVVHLAGESVAEGRWSDERKRAIRDSRVVSTHRLAEAVAELPQERRPRAFVSASAIGIYGDRGDEVLSESAVPGQGFLADVCREWEAESLGSGHLSKSGIRVVAVRIGIVLSNGGGALAQLLPIFKLGLGGPVGGGTQWMSWIHIDDLVSVFLRAIQDAGVRGALNAVAPEPVTGREFASALGRSLGKPAVIPIPKFALKLGFGEMASVILGSQRVQPEILRQNHFEFRYPRIDDALQNLSQKNETKNPKNLK